MGSDATTTSNRLRALLWGHPPTVAMSFDDRVEDSEVTRVMSSGADVAELRIDRFESTAPQDVVSVVRRFSAWPTLATIRHRDEGGEWSGTEAERIALFDAVLPHVDGVDVELARVDEFGDLVESAWQSGRVVVLSFHDFEAMPPLEELDDLIDRAKAAGAEFVKISAMAQSTDDVARLADLTLRRRDAGLITIAMGEHGSMSRVFFGALGSRLTYCAGSHHVSGQLSLDETRSLLERFYPR